MNIKSVLRVYSQLRNLTDDETALLETLRQFTDAEREALVEALQPQMTTRSYQKQADARCAHKFELSGALCNRLAKNRVHHDQEQLDYHAFEVKKASKKAASKSSRATALQGQLKASLEAQQRVTGGHLGDGPICGICSHTEDYEDHAEPSPHYHQFQPPASAAHGVGGD